MQEITDYGEVLKTFGLKYVPDNYYWRVGSITKTQGWIIHISGTKEAFIRILETVIPTLLQHGASFKIPRDLYAISQLLTGGFGYINLGKLICIYQENEEDTPSLAKELIRLTEAFKGPVIPTDRHLGAIVYTRYGSFNPVMIPNLQGDSVKHIYDQAGQLTQDPCYVPFQAPSYVGWPFAEITTPLPHPRRKLLNFAYYPLLTLKPDVKGDVLKALYFRKFWSIRSCLIKQGRRHMHVDTHGRDIQDRLQWQYELYQTLHNDIPMPEVFDYFVEYDDTYLAMAFIKGISLRQWLEKVYRDSSWRDLPVPARQSLISRLLEIIRIIQKLHTRGYVHRDITSGNFLIDENGKIWAIDMELAWSIDKKYPTPPYSFGTQGYMSPQQLAEEIPTIHEDIYGLGALSIEVFTNLYADKFDEKSPRHLYEAVFYLTGEKLLAQMLSACLEKDSGKRPSLQELHDTIDRIRRQVNVPGNKSIPFLSETQLENTIKAALRGLVHPDMMTPNKTWMSLMQREEAHIGNAQMEVAIYEGWHTGLAGPLWLIAKAKDAGFDIEDCLPAYRAGWTYIGGHFFANSKNMSVGLYSGGAGIAMAMAEGFNNQLLPPENGNIQLLVSCFDSIADNVTLANGCAGQGMALFNCAPFLDQGFVTTKHSEIINKILSTQEKKGSWFVQTDAGKKRDIFTGLDKGVAGITLYLLAFLKKYDDESVRKSALLSLNWLLEAGQSRKGIKRWWRISESNPTTNIYSSSIGMVGIALCFIKAYELFEDLSYKEAAEGILQSIQPHLVHMEFSLGNGLAGVGTVYLEAWRVFKESLWLERSNWITGLLHHMVKTNDDGSLRWIPAANFSTADLFVGNAGIVYFLIGCHTIDKWPHSSWPV
ncbi:lanthionine synthetase LanC family protein [Flavitalea sp. BT771]|nr:lanthionine synthetase LanC family protein [Flavitalea sp. BT771]